jgi:hypothetical protein
MLTPSRFQHEAEEGAVLLDRYHDSCPNSKPLSQEDKFLTLIDAPRAGVRYLTCRGGVISPDRLRPREYNSRTPHGHVSIRHCFFGSEMDRRPIWGGLFKFEALRSKKSCDRVVDASNSNLALFLLLSHSLACLISTPRCIYPPKRSVSCPMTKMTPV